MVVEISCFAALAIPMFLQRKEDIGSNIPCKQLKSIFQLTSTNEPWLGICQIFENPPDFRSKPTMSQQNKTNA